LALASDIERLWDSFSFFEPTSVFGCAPEAVHGKSIVTTYRDDSKTLPVAPLFAPGGLNTGVLLISLERLHSPGMLQEYWDEVELVVKEGGYRATRFGSSAHGLRFYDQVRELMGGGASAVDTLPVSPCALRNLDYPCRT